LSRIRRLPRRQGRGKAGRSMKVFMMLFSQPQLPQNACDIMSISHPKFSKKRSHQHIENKGSEEYPFVKRSRQLNENKPTYQKP
jgi:hypothetical protein